MTIEDLEEEIHNNLQNVDYEERSNYGIIDAISDAFIKYEAINKNSVIPDVVQQSEQLSLSDFRVGFEYEELQMDSARYLNKGMIWVKKTYELGSPPLHKIQKLLDEGKVRKA